VSEVGRVYTLVSPPIRGISRLPHLLPLRPLKKPIVSLENQNIDSNRFLVQWSKGIYASVYALMVRTHICRGWNPDEAGWVGAASRKDSGATPPRGGIRARMP